jgi:hypothetical protein
LIFLLACNSNQETKKQTSVVDTTEISNINSVSFENNNTNTSKTEIFETFIDSFNIGEKGKCKIELIKHRVYDENYILIKFYRRGHKNWNLQNTYSYETNLLMGFAPDISDYNNDKINDITFI